MGMRARMIRIGTAGWAIPRQHAPYFPADGSLLKRYAAVFNCAEINSTFYQSHRAATYMRWAETVPGDFRFSVKMPKAITHERRLIDIEAPLDAFLSEILALGEKLGPLLVQFPGRFEFEAERVRHFLALLRERTTAPVVCEPRHAGWFGKTATALFVGHKIVRVATDPPPVPAAALPGGWEGLAYFRLHGSPRMYFSAYEPAWLAGLARQIAVRAEPETWCVFDNTGSGAAAENALALKRALDPDL